MTPGPVWQKGETDMDIQEVIQELETIKNYCAPSALAALDYAIAVLAEKQEKQGREQA